MKSMRSAFRGEKYPRYALVLTLLGLLALALVPSPIQSATSVGGPSVLLLSSVPPRLPADGGTYRSLIVSLQNSSGRSVIAQQSVQVYLSSDLPSVASVSPVVIIQEGQSSAVANVTTSTTPGRTNVTATAVGLQTSSVEIQTVVPSGFPDHLAVFGAPSVQLAGASAQGQIIVQVQDDLGIPARVASDLPVSVSSSDLSTVTISKPSLTVPAGASMVAENYTGLVTGSATVTASATGFTSGSTVIQVVRAPALVLRVTAEPGLIAPNSQGRIVVSLLDQNGDPAEAPANINVFLTSSNLTMLAVAGAVGTNPAEVTILKNSVYAETTFSSLSINLKANATITASAQGLVTGFAGVAVERSQPTPLKLSLYLAPNPVPSNQQSLPAIGIGLLSLNRTSGAIGPLQSASTFPVVVTASDNATGRVIQSSIVQFIAGTSYARASFNSTLLPSTTVITAAAQGLISAQVLVRTERPDLPIGPPPATVVVTSIAPSLPADGNQYQGLLVSLEDKSGDPAIAPVSISVSLALNRPDIVQLVNPAATVTVPAGRSYAIVMVRTLSVEGTVNVTAGSLGYNTSWALLSTKALSPAKLALFISPSPTMLSSYGASAYLAVQLQDANGDPARARADTPITLVSSNSSLLPKPVTLDIQTKADYRLIAINGSVPTRSVITAISPGLVPANATFSSFGLALSVVLSYSPSTIYPNQTSTFTASVSIMHQPVQNVSIAWHVTGGTLSGAQTMTGANGYATAVFHPSGPGFAVVYATASNVVVGTRNSTLDQVVVAQFPVKLSQSPTLVSQLIGYLPYIGVAAAAAVVVAFFLVRRRRHGGDVGEEDSFDIGPAPGEGTAFDLRGMTRS